MADAIGSGDVAGDDELGDGETTDGGVTARFSPSDLIFRVAPTTGSTTNTLRPALRPSACWRMDDARFHFDSSFILPDASLEFSLLASLRPPLPDPDGGGLLLSVFGHFPMDVEPLRTMAGYGSFQQCFVRCSPGS